MSVGLDDVLKDLETKTFNGVGISKYYPKDSDSAYYRMFYSPGRLEICHKSPWGPSVERIVVNYNGNDYMDFEQIQFFLDGKVYKTILGAEADDEIDPILFLIKYLFKDPRVVLNLPEDFRQIPNDGSEECHRVVLDSPSSATTVWAEFFIANGSQLTKLRLRKFLLGKEIYSQNMDIIFSLPA